MNKATLNALQSKADQWKKLSKFERIWSFLMDWSLAALVVSVCVVDSLFYLKLIGL